MSETCGGCVYDGIPLDGVLVGIEAEDRISIGGPVLFSGYRGRPDLTAVAFEHGCFTTADRGGWLTDPDGTHRLEVLGRVDDVVVSGGYNVDLAAVELRAQAWPGLGTAELAVVGVAHPEWGVEVVAVTNEAFPIDDLRAWIRAELPLFAAPRRLVVVDHLPRTSSGKVDRRLLRTDLAGHRSLP